jgi:hypothetical protein
MRALAALAWVTVAAAVGAASFVAVRRITAADLVTDQDLPADVRAEVDTTWAAFLEVFGPRRHCFDDVRLRLVGEVGGGDARYLPDGRRIEIEIPTSPARFRDSLAHELAHHVEHSCGAFGELRREFAALPGLAGRDWNDEDDRWEDRPAELWAEAAVELVTGTRVRTGRTFDLPTGSTEIVAAWAAGA